MTTQQTVSLNNTPTKLVDNNKYDEPTMHRHITMKEQELKDDGWFQMANTAGDRFEMESMRRYNPGVMVSNCYLSTIEVMDMGKPMCFDVVFQGSFFRLPVDRRDIQLVRVKVFLIPIKDIEYKFPMLKTYFDMGVKERCPDTNIPLSYNDLFYLDNREKMVQKLTRLLDRSREVCWYRRKHFLQLHVCLCDDVLNEVIFTYNRKAQPKLSNVMEVFTNRDLVRFIMTFM